jgi:beta-carotene hydroxylase
MEKTGRYGETRAWKSPVGTLLTAGMEYHLVHHLFPAIPLNKTPAAYRELRPLLAEQGIDVDSLPA